MKTYNSKTDFKKLERKTFLILLFVIIFSLITGYFSRELRPYKYGRKNNISRTQPLIIAGVIDIVLIVIVLNVKKIKTITINEQSSFIAIDFIKGFQQNKRKIAYLNNLRYKIDTEDGKHNVTLSDNKYFYFIITEDEFNKNEQLEIASYLKEIRCRTLN